MVDKKIVLCGVLVGVYLNVLAVLPFLNLDYFVWIAVLTVYSVISFPLVAYFWDLSDLAFLAKIRFFFLGFGLISAAFSVLYSTMFFIGDFESFFVDNSIISLVNGLPVVGFLTSLVIISLFFLAGQSRYPKTGNLN